MALALDDLPNDVESLKALIIAADEKNAGLAADRDRLEHEQTVLTAEVARLTEQNERLDHIIDVLRGAQFGRKANSSPSFMSTTANFSFCAPIKCLASAVVAARPITCMPSRSSSDFSALATFAASSTTSTCTPFKTLIFSPGSPDDTRSLRNAWNFATLIPIWSVG